MRRSQLHRQRGQTFPIWIGSIFITLVFTFLLINYANILTMQQKAQNAADSAASAVVAIQAQQFNQMEEILYGTDVEEYRIRHLLEGIRISAQSSGGCNVSGRSCAVVYQNLYKAYMQSLYRFDKDMVLLSSATSSMGFQHEYSDAYVMLQRLKSACASSPQTSSDCGFQYALSGFTVRNLVGNGNFYPAAALLQGPGASVTSASNDYFGPLAVEVSVCAKVNPIFSNLWVFGSVPSVTVTARGAATDAMIVQDWVQPGSVINPATGTVYQPTEVYGDPDSTGYNWYAVNYGGNAVSSNPSTGMYAGMVNNDEFSVHMGWWGPLPIFPFTGSKTVAALFGSNAGACR
jgi:hypothetical protein